MKIINLFKKKEVIELLVDGNSMLPEFKNGEVVKIETMSTNLIKRDLTLYNSPDGLFIKRVVAVEGDVVRFDKGFLYINEEPVYEGNIFEDEDELNLTEWVPQGHVFICGDNRSASTDSRTFGSVPVEDCLKIIAKRY